jgi:hypothetical protein
LATRCALLEIAVDPGRLYDSADDNFLLWVSQVAEKVNAENRKNAAKMKRG